MCSSDLYPGGIPTTMAYQVGDQKFTSMPDGLAFAKDQNGNVNSYYPDGSFKSYQPGDNGAYTSTTAFPGGYGVATAGTPQPNGGYNFNASMNNGMSTFMQTGPEGSVNSGCVSPSGMRTDYAVGPNGEISSNGMTPDGVKTNIECGPNGASTMSATAGDGTMTTQTVSADGAVATSVVSPDGVQVNYDTTGTTITSVASEGANPVVVTVNPDGSVAVQQGEIGRAHV